MIAINLDERYSLQQTVLNWIQRNHPKYPIDRVRVWEEDIRQDECNPYTDLYNVVYFLDAIRKCITLTGMAIYGDWEPKIPFPQPVKIPEKQIVYSNVSLVPVSDIDLDVSVTVNDLKKRIRWLNDDDEPFPFPNDPKMDQLTRKIVGMVPMELEFNWNAHRLDKERQTFMKQHITDEMAEQIMPERRYKRIEPTIYDIRWYYTHYPEDAEPPKNWWSVGLELLSKTVGESLPLYPRYKVHICFRHVPDLLWNYMVNEERRLKTHIWKKNIPPPPQLKHLGEYITETMPRKRRRTKEKEGKQFESQDIEDLLLPPCLASIVDMNRGSFPGDSERQPFVRVMRAAKVPVERIGAILDPLNDKYPHPGGHYDTAKKRWDYQAHYEKGYKNPNCVDLCNLCPFSGSEDQRKMQCHNVFKSKHPEYYRNGDEAKFYNPASWVYWGRRIKKL